MHGQPNSCGTANDLGGLDLLSLDVRETHLPDGSPAVDFRVGVQDGKEGTTQKVQISVTAGGKAQVFDFAGPTGNYSSSTCSRLSGPIKYPDAANDGDVMAVDCFASYVALGVNGTGAPLSAISVKSLAADKPYDQMPGTWYDKDKGDTLVPRVPECEVPSGVPSGSPCETPTADDASGGKQTPGAYTTAGPAQLVKVTASSTAVTLTGGAQKVTLTFASSLNHTEQVLSLNMSAPTTVQASLDGSSVVLGNTTKTVILNVVGATKDGTITVTVTSDLGAHATIAIAVKAPPPPPPTCNPAATEVSGTASCAPGTDTSSSNAAGAPEMLFVALLVAGLAGTRRRSA
ncbi:MAG: hypothetical protein ABR562_07980 [Thermoplasmatota archaeon]